MFVGSSNVPTQVSLYWTEYNRSLWLRRKRCPSILCPPCWACWPRHVLYMRTCRLQHCTFGSQRSGMQSSLIPWSTPDSSFLPFGYKKQNWMIVLGARVQSCFNPGTVIATGGRVLCMRSSDWGWWRHPSRRDLHTMSIYICVVPRTGQSISAHGGKHISKMQDRFEMGFPTHYDRTINHSRPENALIDKFSVVNIASLHPGLTLNCTPRACTHSLPCRVYMLAAGLDDHDHVTSVQLYAVLAVGSTQISEQRGNVWWLITGPRCWGLSIRKAAFWFWLFNPG